MKLLSYVNLIVGSSLLVSAAAPQGPGPEKSQDHWECFRFFASSDDKPQATIDFELTTEQQLSQWSVFVSPGNNYKSDIDYLNLNRYICNDLAIAEGACTDLQKGSLIEDAVLKKHDHTMKEVLTSEKKKVSYGIPETGAYCVYLHNTTPQVDSYVDIIPNYKHGVSGSDVNLRITYIIRCILSLLLLVYYVKQWEGKEMELDTLNKLMILYYAGMECVVPLLRFLQITFTGWHITFLALLLSFMNYALNLLGDTSRILFISLLLRGYTALPKEEYPLKSAHYRMAFILTLLIFIASNLVFFIGPSLVSVIYLITYIYQVTQYYKSDTLLKSLSLRSSTRRAMTLKLMLFYIPLFWLLLIILIVAMIAANKIEALTLMKVTREWIPSAELAGFIFAAMIDPLILFVILFKYWTPELIYADSFGFEPTIDLTELDTEVL